MKKVLSMIAALLLCVGTQAQIVSSRSAIVKTEKQASSTQWFLRAGLNIMNFSGDGAEGADSNIGYNATFGYQKPLGSTGGYWGMEFGLGSRGFKVEDTKCMAHNIQYSPFTFGWKFAVADNVHIDPHVGVFASYDYTSKMKADGESISWGDYADPTRRFGIRSSPWQYRHNCGTGRPWYPCRGRTSRWRGHIRCWGTKRTRSFRRRWRR